PHDRQTVTASSAIAAQHLVSPDDAITVAFNQPMNHAAVAAGLRIEPATQVTTSWSGNNLVITPVHHLAGNTPYTLTISQRSLVAASGATAAAPMQITFGTAPTPPPSVSTTTPPVLATTALGTAQSGSALLFAPDGAVVSTAATSAAKPVIATPPPSASPVAETPSPATAQAQPAASSAAAASPTASPPSLPTGPSLIEYRGSSAPLVLGPAASAAAFAPNGSALAAAIADGGNTRIVVSQPDGTQPSVLATVPRSVVGLTWTSNSRVEFATATAVQAVSIGGSPSTVATTSAPVAALAPGGAHAYVAPSGGAAGRLLDLQSGSSRALTGATTADSAAFSGDGSTIAWLNASGSQQQLMTEPVAHDSAALVAVVDPGTSLQGLALNKSGDEVAYTEAPKNAAAKLVVAQVPSGTPLATGPAAARAAFSPDGGTLALITGSQLQVVQAPLPGASTHPQQSTPAAGTALHAFVDAQVSGNGGALPSLSAPNVDSAGLTPHGLSRASIIDAVAQPDGSLHADVSLLVDPSGARAAPLVADETLTIASAGDGAPFLVTSLNVSPLHQQSAGPHVVHVESTLARTALSVQVSFDSDLNPASVAQAITVQAASGTTVPGTVTYNAETRTATVLLSADPGGQLTVVVGTSLQDVNGQSPATRFSAPVRP
ncbi:MAG: Ig-like domain-containing protein, partial [Candidatus Dormibacteria bacterium]